ncbi:hypothetical protein KIL84_019772 [Mauremys mutica]|uniref:Uncharacterized protein n=1 Tax=Mauremys mutica TaxID=74926 RepID=A0A9D3XVM4_9SAUR|nr:hypothetical protein KIL84_019772 [Mauremys mutica]
MVYDWQETRSNCFCEVATTNTTIFQSSVWIKINQSPFCVIQLFTSAVFTECIHLSSQLSFDCRNSGQVSLENYHVISSVSCSFQTRLYTTLFHIFAKCMIEFTVLLFSAVLFTTVTVNHSNNVVTECVPSVSN